MRNKTFKVALVGNPNCGKTTIFNLLTGTRQHVGNYAGVTVESKTGICHLPDGKKIEIIDLPGIYSLSSSSPEETVALRELLNDDIDLVLNVIDAGNAQRNLYLTMQLTELGLPLMLVFNMFDEATTQGLKFDLPMLEGFFGAKIVTTVGSQGVGIDELLSALKALLGSDNPPHPIKMHYGPRTDMAIGELSDEVAKLGFGNGRVPARYFAIKILESDPEICAKKEFLNLLARAEELRRGIAARNGMNSSTLMADVRYGVIAGACREAITRIASNRRQISDVIDKYATNRFLGIPIFLILMYLVFYFTFTLGEYPMAALEWFFEHLGAGIGALWPENVLPFLRAMLLEGIINGVGGVLIFLPNILFLFLAIAILEGTGYMARAAFVMDGFMHKFGLHGKSFIPMLLGFGCSVPAVMATRTIDNERDRLTTIMIVPFMSCGARLPIYALIIPAFFAENIRALMMWLLYLIGVAVALGCALLLKRTIFKDEGEVFVMELPPYRLPTLRSIMILMWEKTAMYLQKAGTIILAASVVLFILTTLPEKRSFELDYPAEIAAVEASQELAGEEKAEAISRLRAQRQAELLRYSFAGRIGSGLSYALEPIGFDWRVSSALIGAFAAKELFVAQLGILYAVEDAEEDTAKLQEILRANYTALQGFCIMLFCLLTVPCIATVAVVKRETNSWWFALAQILLYTLTAYGLTFVVYQTGLLLRM